MIRADLIVTRHRALVEYLVKKGLVKPSVTVKEHVTRSDVEGKHVIGVLPLHLAAAAARVTEIPLNVPAEKRGRELTIEEVEQYAQPHQTYLVVRLREPEEEST